MDTRFIFLVKICIIIILGINKFGMAQEETAPLGYVPPGFERPYYYAFDNFLQITLPGFLSKIFGDFGTTIYKALAFWNRKTFDVLVNENNTQINGVDARIYTLKSSNVTINKTIMIFYHGGSYIFGDVNDTDTYLREFVKQMDMIVISVKYKLAPTFPYPRPVDDCYNLTKFVINNAQLYGGDPNKIILSGESAGGNAVAVISQRLLKEKNRLPKLQVLIYPWVQLVDSRLPAQRYYGDSMSDMWENYFYMGYTNVTSELATAYYNYNHFMLINDINLRNKYISYLNVDNIPNQYKVNRTYYARNGNPVRNTTNYSPLNQSNIFVRDKSLANLTLRMFETDGSPLFADDKDFVGLPMAYMIALEWDYIKDECLLYAQRLRTAGVNLTLAFYENAFHGIVSEIKSYSIARKMQSDLINYLKANNL